MTRFALLIASALLAVPAGLAGPCDLARQIRCGETVSGDTSSGGISLFTSYSCTPDMYTGPEAFFVFANPRDQGVSLRLEGGPPGLDLLILSACDPGACLRADDRRIDAVELPAGDYVLVVDGRDAAEGPFEIVANCGRPVAPEMLDVSLPAGGSLPEDKTVFLIAAFPQADVLFSMDLTSSMNEEREQLSRNAKKIVTDISWYVTDLRFGLVSHEDYPETYGGRQNCDYADTYGGVADLPYRLDLPLQAGVDAFKAAVDAMKMGGGMDLPESYARVIYEAANDPAIGWRAGSRRIVVMFGDSVPHDCDLFGCYPDPHPAESRGLDPGRDGRVGTTDDIPILDALDGLATVGEGAFLMYFDSSGKPQFTDLWNCWASRTGGFSRALNPDGTVPAGTNLSQLVLDAILEKAAVCGTLSLVPDPAWKGWVLSITPPEYTNVALPATADFQLTIGPPPGTPEGDYTFTVDVVCDGQVLGQQQVTIHVGPCRIVAGATPPDAVCEGAPVRLDGSPSTATGCSGEVRYRWWRGGAIVRDWDPDPVALAPPQSGPALAVLEMRCFDDPACRGSSATQLFLPGPDPDPIPPPVGASLRVTKRKADAGLAWWDLSSSIPCGGYEAVAVDGDTVFPPTPIVMESVTLLGKVPTGAEYFLHAGAIDRPCRLGSAASPCRLLYYKVRATSPCSGTPGPACNGFPMQVPCP